MPADDLRPNFQVTGRKQWVNWHENFKPQPLKKLIDVWNVRPGESRIEWYNATTKGFQEVIAEALGSENSVRALGGGWSFSDVARTDGILLNTRPLNYRFRINRDQAHPSYAGDTSNLAFVQCGISIADLNRYLRDKGKSLKTSGASNGQTIAGALSTGTHGSALDIGAIQDYVVGLHLIVAPDKAVWLERASHPVVADAFPNVLQAELIRDDEIFNAALISFGCFGIIHGVVVEAADLYYLQAYRRLMTLDEGLWKAINSLDFTDISLPRPATQRPFHFQFVINPFDGAGKGYVTVMYKDSTPASDCNSPSPGSKLKQGDGALEVIGVISEIASAVTPTVVNHLIQRFYNEYEGVCGTHGEIFTDTTTRGKAASTAMGIPLGRVREAVNIALPLIASNQTPALVALRYVRSSEASLAFTLHRPHTCVLEIDGPRSRQVTNTYKQIWRAFDEARIPYTFHWGKMNNLDAERVRKMFGEQRVGAWIAARRKLLPTSGLRRVFSNDFLAQLRMNG